MKCRQHVKYGMPSQINAGRTFLLIATGSIILIGLTLLFYAVAMDIQREMPLPLESAFTAADTSAKPVVRVGVISRYPPTIMYRGYQPIMDYLTSHTAYRFELLLSQDYNEALHNLVDQKVSAVFLGAHMYIEAHERYGVIPVLKPLNENLQPLSRSVLFVRQGSDIRAVKDMAGRKLALRSSESFSSHWLLDYELPRNKLQPDDLAQIHHFAHHNTVIAQVLNGTYDAGVTREHLMKDLFKSGFRAVSYSVPIPSPPIATTANADPNVIAAMKTALLAVNRDEELRASITKEWDVEFVYGFVEASNEDYDVVRAVVENHVR